MFHQSDHVEDMVNQNTSDIPKTRLRSIDAFRGFAIVTMVLANYLAGVEWIPAWLKHAPDVGLTVTRPGGTRFLSLPSGSDLRPFSPQAAAAGWNQGNGGHFRAGWRFDRDRRIPSARGDWPFCIL